MNLRAYDFSAAELLFLFIALFFLMAAVACIFFLFASRVIKNYNQSKERKLQQIFQQSLNSIIFNEDAEMPLASYQFHLNELKRAMGKSVFARHVIVRQLISIKKSLTGSSSARLDRIYRDLNLIEFSEAKLKSSHWKTKAQGIRELTEMNYYDKALFKGLQARARNQTLQEEIFMAIVRLDNENPLSFFENYVGEVSDWMKINVYRYLAFRDVRTLPEFSEWFSNPNVEVVLFAIGMTKQFRQMSAIDKLVKLVFHPNERIVAAAVTALMHLNAFQALREIISVSQDWWKNEEVSRAIVQYVGEIGHEESHVEFLYTYLEHESFVVRSEATSAIAKMGADNLEKLQAYDTAHHGKWSALIAHASEPLLK